MDNTFFWKGDNHETVQQGWDNEIGQLIHLFHVLFQCMVRSWNIWQLLRLLQYFRKGILKDTRKVVQNMTLKNKLKLKQQFIGKFIFIMNDDLQAIHVYSIWDVWLLTCSKYELFVCLNEV